MKNIQALLIKEKTSAAANWGVLWRGAAFAAALALSAPFMAQAETLITNDDVNSRGVDPTAQDPPSGYIGTNEEGDSVMRTGPRQRNENDDVRDYENGMIISPEITPIIPMRPGPRPPFNPYPGPGPHPGPQPRDGVNQMHEYNHNPEYPLEAPRRSFGGGGGGGGGGPRGGGSAF